MKVCAMITVFKPNKDKLTANLKEISLYAEKIYLLVNDSSFDVDLSTFSKAELVINGKNIGLSAAFNIGLKKADAEGFEEAVLFDQDSFLSNDNFQKMYEEFIETKENNSVMCLGPSLNVYGTILPTPKWTLSKRKVDSTKMISVKNIITSGMILDIKNALSIGGFEETLPVDFCDFYFCWKSLYNGFFVLKSVDSFINHEIGNSSIKIGKSTVHFHSPYRNYFLVRDTLRVVFRFKETPFSIRFRYFIFLFPRMILFLMKCDRKLERLKMYRLGFKDFFTKNYGFGSVATLLNAEG